MQRYTTRVAALLLSLLLGMSLLAPGAAATDSEPEERSYAPVITAQPSAKVKGDTITLTVTAQLPEGVEGELSYRWYRHVSMLATPSIGEGASITAQVDRTRDGSLLDGDNAVEYLLFVETYYVRVTNHFVDEEGNPDSSTVTSKGVAVMVRGRYGDLVSAYWEEHGEGDMSQVERVLAMAVSLPIAFVQYLKALFLFAGVSVVSNLDLL